MSVFEKGKKTILSRDEILAVSDIQIERVPVPEWGGDVFVKGMTGAERDRFEASVIRIEGKEGQDTSLDLSDMRAKLCAATICTEEGKKLFTPSDIKALTKKSAAALQRAFLVAQKLSGITDDDVKELSEGMKIRPFEDSALDSPDI